MTGFDQLLGLLGGVTVWDGVKWLMVLGLVLYGVFGVVVVRQVQLMSRTVNGALEWPLKMLAWAHLGVAGVALIAAIAIL